MPRGRKAYDYVGKRVHKLFVLRELSRDRHGVRWLCQCDCGNTTEQTTDSLNTGKVVSCGCRKRAHAKLIGGLNKGQFKENTAFRALLGVYKRGAAKRGLEWNITEDQFRSLTSAKCYYTGREPTQLKKPTSGCPPYKYNGIDRLDSNIGYTPSNCVPCCWEVNEFKGSRNHRIFLALIQEIAGHVGDYWEKA